MKILTNKTAIVTGAASGIGLAVTRAFVSAGANVAMLDIEESALKKAKESLGKVGAVKVQTFVADVTNREQMQSVADQIKSDFGKVHILMNNAGINTMLAIEEMSYKEWDWCIGVNLGGVINGLQSFLPLITAHSEGGHILNTSSAFGMRPVPQQAAYCGAKYAVVGISESIRMDLAPKNIGVSVLCPGIIATNIMKSARNRPDDLAGGGEAGMKEMEPFVLSEGLSPDKVAEQVLRGIKANKPYIFTHAGVSDDFERRFQKILAAFDGTEASGGSIPDEEFQ